MPDHHYHANHVDAPARGSKRLALRDAKRLRVEDEPAEQRVPDPGIRGVDGPERVHGLEYPLIVKCWRPECEIRREP
jgi:hypothetical protein